MRRPASRTATLAIAVLAVFTLWITWRAKALEMGMRGHSSNSALLQKPAPAFDLDTTDGRKVSLAGYRGRSLVVTFWASWCGPCRMELPVLRSFYQSAHKSDSNFEIVAISVDQSLDDARTAAADLKIPFPVLHDAGGKVSNAYGVDGIPALFVIDPNGIVKYTSVGFDMGLEVMLAGQLGIKNYSGARQ